MLLGRTNAGFLYVFDTPTRLLVVDDDPIMREFAVGQLEHPGGEIVTAGNGEEALAILRADPSFDLVLSDLEMPVMNGFSLLSALRAEPATAHLPVVVITSRDDMFAIDRAYEVGATSFVAKPVNWRLMGYQLRYVLRAAKMEAALREARIAAEQADRLKESLLMLLQHETRTPLNAIVGYSELMQAALGPAGDPKAYLAAIIEAARGLDETLKRVFYFAQLSADTIGLDCETLEAGEFLEDEAHRRRRAAAAAGATLEVRAEPGCVVRADAHHLATAIGELVSNALAHAPAGGTVRLSARREADGGVALCVSDEGPGVGEDVLARVREPFLQAESALVRRTGGLGLGLPTARRIAEMHGGRLDLVSAPGTGLTAAILLPPPSAMPVAPRKAAA